MEIVYRVKEARLKKELTIRELSTKSGVSKSEISDIERGRVHPSVFTLCLLASALDVDARRLFDYSVSEFSDKY